LNMSDFSPRMRGPTTGTKMKPPNSTDLELELNIRTASRLARKSHDDIRHAMVSGALQHHRDKDGRRVVKLGDLLASMRGIAK
jgi:hypothetical protein